MKKITALLLTLLLLTGSLFQVTASADSLADVGLNTGSRKAAKILLIGNSYTYFNDFENILKNVCESAGRKARITCVAKNGAALSLYANKKTPLGRRVHRLLKNEKWDFVVLQDRHFLPVVNPAKTRRAVRSLKPYIEASGAKMALFMTWVPVLGHRDYTDYKDFISGRRDFQAKLAASCERIAKDVNAILIPTGLSFYKTQHQKTGITLISSDKSHPTYAGSYLSACTMYDTLFKNSPKISFTGDLKASQARILQRNAKETVAQFNKVGSKL